eukprot:6203028-Pleurochrysis_carterae.AAC.1
MRLQAAGTTPTTDGRLGCTTARIARSPCRVEIWPSPDVADSCAVLFAAAPLVAIPISDHAAHWMLVDARPSSRRSVDTASKAAFAAL